MKFRLLPLLGALAGFFSGAHAAPPAHLDRGLTLVDQITAAQAVGIYTGVVDGVTVFLNRYGGSWNSPTNPSFIRFFNFAASDFTGPYAANYTECSPLVTHLLRHTYGWDWKQYPIPDPLNPGAFISRSSPSSYLYVSAMKHQIGFAARIASFLDVQPGDIGAYWTVGTDNGHTWIVVSADFAGGKTYPAANSVSASDPNYIPALAGAVFYELTVLDSSRSGHTNDTRLITYRSTTPYLSGGVGVGVMGIFADQAGNVLGHTWSIPTSSYLKTVNGVTQVNPSWLSAIKSRVQLQAQVETVFGRLPGPIYVPLDL